MTLQLHLLCLILTKMACKMEIFGGCLRDVIQSKYLAAEDFSQENKTTSNIRRENGLFNSPIYANYHNSLDYGRQGQEITHIT